MKNNKKITIRYTRTRFLCCLHLLNSRNVSRVQLVISSSSSSHFSQFPLSNLNFVLFSYFIIFIIIIYYYNLLIINVIVIYFI